MNHTLRENVKKNESLTLNKHNIMIEFVGILSIFLRWVNLLRLKDS